MTHTRGRRTRALASGRRTTDNDNDSWTIDRCHGLNMLMRATLFMVLEQQAVANGQRKGVTARQGS